MKIQQCILFGVVAALVCSPLSAADDDGREVSKLAKSWLSAAKAGSAKEKTAQVLAVFEEFERDRFKVVGQYQGEKGWTVAGVLGAPSADDVKKLTERYRQILDSISDVEIHAAVSERTSKIQKEFLHYPKLLKFVLLSKGSVEREPLSFMIIDSDLSDAVSVTGDGKVKLGRGEVRLSDTWFKPGSREYERYGHILRIMK